MANFTIRAASGVTVKDWTDAQGALPSRLNPVFGLPHRYLSVPRYGFVIVYCWPDNSIEIPTDASLGGNLFSAAWAEGPCASLPPVAASVGRSSIITTRLETTGHYLLEVLRPFGGQQLMHLICE